MRFRLPSRGRSQTCGSNTRASTRAISDLGGKLRRRRRSGAGSRLTTDIGSSSRDERQIGLRCRGSAGKASRVRHGSRRPAPVQFQLAIAPVHVWRDRAVDLVAVRNQCGDIGAVEPPAAGAVTDDVDAESVLEQSRHVVDLGANHLPGIGDQRRVQAVVVTGERPIEGWRVPGMQMHADLGRPMALRRAQRR